MKRLMSVSEALARALAFIGGGVLCFLVVLICTSIVGRSLNSLAHAELLHEGLSAWLITAGVGPVKGDYEVTEAGVAFAIFAFLPICQLYGAHATVDVFTRGLSRRSSLLLFAFWEIVLCIIIWLVTWRLFAGLEGKFSNGETTFLLQFPVWWSYAASFVAALGASAVAGACVIARIGEAISMRPLLPRSSLLARDEAF